MDGVIDEVATVVETGLNEAMELIAEGRRQVQEYVASLPADLQNVGQQAADRIQAQFDSLKESVDAKRDQLIDSLAQKYTDNLKAVDARIEEMKAANRGLVDAALDAIKAVIETIIKLKNMLLGVLARAAGVIGKIIKDPIGFVGNLVAGVAMGLQNFIANLGSHLQKGLMEWLFGAMAEAGIQMPATFDLKGILSLVLQVLGLTYANIRARAVRILGEEMVSRLEQVAEIFMILVTQGPAGLWQYIKDKVGDLKTMVVEGIKSFVMEKIIIAGITWIVSLLNPASAFIKACKAIYDIIMFFVTRGSQIMALVNAVLDSVEAIASGAIGGAAAAVENALARGIPVVIGFLASLLGLGGISQKIRSIIERIQAPVNAAIDWVINKAVAIVKKTGQLLGIGKQDKEDETAVVAMEGVVKQSFTMDTQGHTLTAKAEGESLSIKVASAVEIEVQSALSAAIGEVNAKPKFPGKPKIRQRLEAAYHQADYNLILSEWKRGEQPGKWPDFLAKKVMAIVASLTDLGNQGIPSLDQLFGKLKRNDGTYGHIPDPPDVDFGQPFSATQRTVILAANMKKNGGVIKSDVSHIVLDDSLPATDPRKPNIDHIYPRSAGGSNGYSNAKVLARDENAAKSATILSPMAYQAPAVPAGPTVIVRKKKSED